MWIKMNFFKIKSQIIQKQFWRQLSSNNRFAKLLLTVSSPIPIHLALEKARGNYTLSSFVNESLGENEDDYRELDFLRFVLQSNYTEVQQFLNENYDINQKLMIGLHPLHIACNNGDKAMVKFLTENGADVNATDDFEVNDSLGKVIRSFYIKNELPVISPKGLTPLDYADMNRSYDIVEYLTRNGAAMRRCNKYVKTNNMNGATSSVSELPESNYSRQLEKLVASRQNLFFRMVFNMARTKYMDNVRRDNNPFEETVKAHIVGQLMPIRAVAAALRRKQNGWSKEDLPLVFLFLGSSGVGKTNLARLLAQYIHGKEVDGFIRIDLSGFQTCHDVAKLIGSPPGNVGFEHGGQLTGKLKDHPEAVVLLEEVDKAHPAVLRVILQLFDEGNITDGKGRTIHCPNAIFVMSSNLAQREIAVNSEMLRTFVNKAENPIDAEMLKEGVVYPSKEKSAYNKFVDEIIYPILHRHFHRDKFIARINEILFFLPFDEDELRALINIELKHWARKTKIPRKIKISWSKQVVDIIKEGYKYYGVRSIKNEVDRLIINKFAEAHENKLIQRGSSVKIIEKNGEIGLKIE